MHKDWEPDNCRQEWLPGFLIPGSLNFRASYTVFLETATIAPFRYLWYTVQKLTSLGWQFVSVHRRTPRVENRR
jgi:hypothetical protein